MPLMAGVNTFQAADHQSLWRLITTKLYVCYHPGGACAGFMLLLEGSSSFG
jgi:hypothetical protein